MNRQTKKVKISELKIGDVVIIEDQLFDVYDAPTRLNNEEYIFQIVRHRTTDVVGKMSYITPANLGYENSANFHNGEIDLIIKEECA